MSGYGRGPSGRRGAARNIVEYYWLEARDGGGDSSYRTHWGSGESDFPLQFAFPASDDTAVLSFKSSSANERFGSTGGFGDVFVTGEKGYFELGGAPARSVNNLRNEYVSCRWPTGLYDVHLRVGFGLSKSTEDDDPAGDIGLAMLSVNPSRLIATAGGRKQTWVEGNFSNANAGSFPIIDLVIPDLVIDDPDTRYYFSIIDDPSGSNFGWLSGDDSSRLRGWLRMEKKS